MVDPVHHDPAALLAAYKVEAGPPPGVEARMLASLHGQIGLAAMPGVGASAGGSGGSGAGGGAAGAAVTAGTTVGATAAGTKLLAGLALIVTTALGAGAAAIVHSRGEPAATASARTAGDRGEPDHESEFEPSKAEAASPALALPVDDSVPLAADLELDDEPGPDHALDHRSELEDDVEPRADEPAPRRRRPAEPAPSLAEEAKLLREADQALRRGDLAGARAALDRYREDFARGSLGGQAETLDRLLACARQLPGAREAAARHLDQHPDDRARVRLEAQCDLD